jgi:hypothetical protein
MLAPRGGFYDVLPEMLQEQKKLLATLVEAARKVPRSQQQFLLWSVDAMGPIGSEDYIEGAGLSERLPVLGSDVQWLDEQGFLIAQWFTNGTARFTLDEAAFRYYEEFVAKHSEEPAAAIEEEVRHYLDRPEFRSRFADAFDRLAAAQQMLWQTNPQDDLTTIGHKLREAIQQFATSMVEIHRPPGVDSDPADTKSRLQAVIETNRERLGKRKSELLDALLNYQSAVSDLVQRQEHGDQKPNDPLTWEDARAAVFQTAMVMFEFDRMLSA